MSDVKFASPGGALDLSGFESTTEHTRKQLASVRWKWRLFDAYSKMSFCLLLLLVGMRIYQELDHSFQPGVMIFYRKIVVFLASTLTLACWAAAIWKNKLKSCSKRLAYAKRYEPISVSILDPPGDFWQYYPNPPPVRPHYGPVPPSILIPPERQHRSPRRPSRVDQEIMRQLM